MLRLALLALLVVATPLAAATLQTESRIDRVTVYPQGATVIRVADARVAAGTTTVVIDELPLALKPDSLRLQLAEGEASLGSVELHTRHYRELARERERELVAEKADLEQHRQAAVDRQERFRMQMEFVKSISQPGTDAAASTYHQLPPDRWPQAWEALGDGIATAQAGIREAGLDIESLDKDIARVERELEDIRTGEREMRQARIQLSSTQDQAVRLELRYQVDQASWTPRYAAHLDTSESTLALEQQARIEQKTGETWPDAAITLSTQRPRAGTTIPPLRPWVLRLREPKALRKSGIALMEQEAMAPATTRAAGDVQTDTGEFHAAFRLPGRITIPSGAGHRQVSLARHAMPAELEARTVPRLDPRVLLQATAKFEGETPLLPGPVRLFRDETLVGDTRLAARQPGEEIRLPFGEDDRLRARFLPHPDKRSTSGLIRSRRVIERHYRFELENHHQRPMQVVLMDQLPVAGDEPIEVETTEDTTPPTKRDVDDQEGVLAWEMEMPAGAERTIDLGFTVSYPEDREISGI